MLKKQTSSKSFAKCRSITAHVRCLHTCWLSTLENVERTCKHTFISVEKLHVRWVLGKRTCRTCGTLHVYLWSVWSSLCYRWWQWTLSHKTEPFPCRTRFRFCDKGFHFVSERFCFPFYYWVSLLMQKANCFMFRQRFCVHSLLTFFVGFTDDEWARFVNEPHMCGSLGERFCAVH